MIYEIYGPPGVGKTTHTLNMINKEEKLCLYVNADFQIMENIVDNSLYILNSNDVDVVKESLESLKNSIDTVIIDSLPMLNNKSENISKVITEMQRIISICNRNKIDLYIINQYREHPNQIEDYTYYLNRLYLYYNKRIKVGD